mmetsp:Transcript_14763/g.32077  ORF Transcript_14763/g.32077 Transcript_14763/m.32077 type:complete len:116 (-) Transcript_14763:975-1322(-)
MKPKSVLNAARNALRSNLRKGSGSESSHCVGCAQKSNSSKPKHVFNAARTALRINFRQSSGSESSPRVGCAQNSRIFPKRRRVRATNARRFYQASNLTFTSGEKAPRHCATAVEK